MGQVRCRIATNNTIEVLRKPLQFHHRFVAALGAAREIGELRWAAIECLDNGSTVLRGFVHRAIAPVFYSLDVIQPFSLARWRRSIVCGTRRVSLLQWRSHRGVLYTTCQPPVPHLLILAVPPGNRQPHLKIYLRCLGWSRGSDNSAEIRQTGNGRAPTCGLKRPARDKLCRCNRCVRKRQCA